MAEKHVATLIFTMEGCDKDDKGIGTELAPVLEDAHLC